MANLTVVELAELLKRNLPRVDHRNEVIEEIGQDFIRMRMPVVDSYLSHDLPAGSGQIVLSGPITMGFAETALYACVHAFYGENVLAFTATFNSSFLRIAGAGDLTAIARLVRHGKGLAHVEAHIYSEPSQKPCAHVTASYSITELSK
jgi:uncharacterized protein (TIGR00369 family)